MIKFFRFYHIFKISRIVVNAKALSIMRYQVDINTEQNMKSICRAAVAQWTHFDITELCLILQLSSKISPEISYKLILLPNSNKFSFKFSNKIFENFF